MRDHQAWPLVSCVLVLAVLSCEEQCSKVQRLLHVVQGCRLPRARRPTGGPCRLAIVMVAAGGGRGLTPLRCHPRKNRGVDSMGIDATLQNVGEMRARLQNNKTHKPNDAICEMTGRGNGVSPCRSAYFASLWRLLTLNLRRRTREASLLLPES